MLLQRQFLDGQQKVVDDGLEAVQEFHLGFGVCGGGEKTMGLGELGDNFGGHLK